MNKKKRFLVLGGTGHTGHHFISRVLNEGHSVRTLVRTPSKMSSNHKNLEICVGSITTYEKVDELVNGVDFIVSMLDDASLQANQKINTHFCKKTDPSNATSRS